MTLLEANGLAVGRGAARVVASGITFAAGPGDVREIAGPNGSGKTTLLRTLAGLVAPRGGSFSCRGRRAYLAADEPPPRAVPVSVVEWLALGPRPRGDGRAVLARLGGPVDPRRPVAALSSGEWDRVRLARMLAGPAEILLLDEPDAHADEAGRARIRDALASEPSRVVVVATHRPSGDDAVVLGSSV